MIYLSASSIKDFLTCEKRYQYRIIEPDRSIQTPEMFVGTITHFIIEKYWNDEKLAFENLDNIIKTSVLSTKDIDKLNRFVGTFFEKFQTMLTPDDKIEKNFRNKYSKDVTIVGKLDRILPGDVVIDWKTTAKPPMTISDDVQFIIYYQEYKNLYGVYPSNVLYVALNTGNIIRYVDDVAIRETLYKEIIPDMIKTIKREEYPRSGLVKFHACDNCSYREVCYEEIGK